MKTSCIFSIQCTPLLNPNSLGVFFEWNFVVLWKITSNNKMFVWPVYQQGVDLLSATNLGLPPSPHLIKTRTKTFMQSKANVM